MAYEVTVGHLSGHTITYGAYRPPSTVVTAAGTSIPELAGTGYYRVTDASLVAGDFIVVKVDSVIAYQGQFLPDVSSTALTADLTDIENKIDIIDTNVDALILAEGKVDQVFDSTPKAATSQVTINTSSDTRVIIP